MTPTYWNIFCHCYALKHNRYVKQSVTCMKNLWVVQSKSDTLQALCYLMFRTAFHGNECYFLYRRMNSLSSGMWILEKALQMRIHESGHFSFAFLLQGGGESQNVKLQHKTCFACYRPSADTPMLQDKLFWQIIMCAGSV